MIAAGPGENETTSWTHGKENLSAEDIDRSVVKLLAVPSSITLEGVYIVGEHEHTMARVDTAINPELQSRRRIDCDFHFIGFGHSQKKGSGEYRSLYVDSVDPGRVLILHTASSGFSGLV